MHSHPGVTKTAFTMGYVMQTHHPHFPSTAHIRAFPKKINFGTNIYCAECHSSRVVRYGKRYRYRQCLTRFSLLSPTFYLDANYLFHNSLEYYSI